MDGQHEGLIEDVWLSVIEFLDHLSIVRFSTTCQYFYELSRSDIVWRNLCKQVFHLPDNAVSSSVTSSQDDVVEDNNNNSSSSNKIPYNTSSTSFKSWFEIYKYYIIDRHFRIEEDQDLTLVTPTKIIKGEDNNDTMVMLNSCIPWNYFASDSPFVAMNQATLSYQINVLSLADYAFNVGIIWWKDGNRKFPRDHIGNTSHSFGVNNYGYFWTKKTYQLIREQYGSDTVINFVINVGKAYMDYYVDGSFVLRVTDIFQLHNQIDDDEPSEESQDADADSEQQNENIDDEESANESENDENSSTEDESNSITENVEIEELKTEKKTTRPQSNGRAGDYYFGFSILLTGDSCELAPAPTQKLQQVDFTNPEIQSKVKSLVKFQKLAEGATSADISEW